MSRYALVVVGYNRPEGTFRLLCSLKKAYFDEPVDLIISIDHSGKNDVEDVADAFEWKHGQKKVVTYSERQGLRNHILHCGDFLKDYDAIAVLEDDLIVSPGFFPYMKKTVEKYSGDANVAGISLYNNLFSQNGSAIFEPAYSQYDIYFVQYAHSWGQIWMKKQWFDFKEWYLDHNEEFSEQENIPVNVCRWPETSWLKYHIRYCIETDKYFVYPYRSLTTCFSDIGQHNQKHKNTYQVPLLFGVQKEYRLPEFNEAPVIYDAFFERVLPGDSSIGGIRADEICVDLFASRTGYQNRRYVLSSRELPYKKIVSFGLELRPIEMNALENIPGNGIWLYDTSEVSGKRSAKAEMSVREFQYRWRLNGHTKMLCRLVIDRVKSLFKIKKEQ